MLPQLTIVGYIEFIPTSFFFVFRNHVTIQFFFSGFQPIMTVVGCVNERPVSTSSSTTNLIPPSTPDVSFSGATAATTTVTTTTTTDSLNSNSNFKENERSIARNEVQV